ncbi:unnamed protein product [Camellia sinensis]
MEDNTGSRESKKKSMEDNTRSSTSKEKRRKSMEDNTRSSESKEKRRKSMEDNTRPTDTDSQQRVRVRHVEEEVLQWIAQKPDHHFSFPIRALAITSMRRRFLGSSSSTRFGSGGTGSNVLKFYNVFRENESEEGILDEGDEEADEEHDQEPEVLVQPEPAVNKAPEVSSAPEEGSEGIAEHFHELVPDMALEFLFELDKFQNEETRVYVRIPCSRRRSRASRTSRSAPSFFRKAGQGTPHKMNKLHVGATISSQSVPGQNIVLVRPRTLGQTNPTEHNGPVPMEGDEEIFEEEAVCKNCFHNLKEENILKTECKCGNALIHEDCAAKWSRTRGNNNCDSCGQEVQTFPVTLVRGLSSSTQVVGREESNKSSFFSWRLRRLEFLNIFRLLRAISAIASSSIKGATDEGHNLISIFN